ncbi:hypothetical protein ASPBRDRAFT_123322 [Aspergillus brasiliensis CBS 101740]|uniref:Uncharacterized protein n=1 Tax=Aspergillus brasiliensis (strain CBS 101740 / IMI 381727 / IBT 21946) TaxID=767769 RepID=A0A1L9UM41_ASPBC|nr:hypothetical protein ASPBRDRAFT_123322 [Aspergillus brasiliensis CBS 101740]
MDMRKLSFILLLLSTTLMVYLRTLLARPIYIYNNQELLQVPAPPSPSESAYALAFLDEPVFAPLASHIADHPYPWRDKRPFQETNYALLMGAVQTLLEADNEEEEGSVGLKESYEQQAFVERNSTETYFLWVGDGRDEQWPSCT